MLRMKADDYFILCHKKMKDIKNVGKSSSLINIPQTMFFKSFNFWV